MPIFANRFLVTCGRCQSKTTWPIPSDAELSTLAAHYWGTAQSQDDHAQNVHRAQANSRLDYLVSHLGNLDGTSILDVGAGHGHLAAAFRSSGIRISPYIAVDSDLRVSEALWRNGATAVVPSLNEVHQSIHLAVLSHVLEHVVSPVEFLLSVRKKLLPSGFLFIEVPNRDDEYKRSLASHLHVFSLDGLRLALEEVGMQIVNAEKFGQSIDSLIPRSILHRFMRDLIDVKYPWLRHVKSFLPSAAPLTPNQYRQSMQMDVVHDAGQWLRVLAVPTDE